MESRLRSRKIITKDANDSKNKKTIKQNIKKQGLKKEPVILDEKRLTRQKSKLLKNENKSKNQDIKQYMTTEIKKPVEKNLLTRKTRSKVENQSIERIFSFDEADDACEKTRRIKKKKVTKKKQTLPSRNNNITTVADIQKKLHIIKKPNTIEDKSDNLLQEKKFFKSSVKDLNVVLNMDFFSQTKPIKTKRANKRVLTTVCNYSKDNEMKTKENVFKTETPNKQVTFKLMDKQNIINKDKSIEFSSANLKDKDCTRNKQGNTNVQLNENQNCVKITSNHVLSEENKINISGLQKNNIPTKNPFRQTNIFNNRFTQKNPTLLNSVLSPIRKINSFVKIKTPPPGQFSQNKNLFQSTPLIDHNFTKRASERRILGESTNFSCRNSQQKGILNKIQESASTCKDGNTVEANTSIIHKENIKPLNSNEFTVEAVIECSPTKKNYKLQRLKDISGLQSSSLRNNTVINYDEISSNDANIHCNDQTKYQEPVKDLSLRESPILNGKKKIESTSSDILKSDFTIKSKRNENKDISIFNVENAFGFDTTGRDEIDEQNVSKHIPILRQVEIKPNIQYLNQLKKKSKSATVNYLVKEIETIISTNDANYKVKNTLDISSNKPRNKKNESNSYTDTINWSNTFDIDSFETNKEENTVSLFTDLNEPTHFKQPVKHAYTRKRAFTYFTEDEKEEQYEDKKIVKKRKVQKEQKPSKEVLKWVNDINKTFEEIDKYNLCIE